MRPFHLLAALLLAAGPIHGQAISPPTGSIGPVAPSTVAPATLRPRHTRTMAERFDAANTTHEGRLTLAQAWAGHMNAVARDFHAIDTRHRGYVTMADIRAYAKMQRAARHAAPVDTAE